MQFRKHRKSSSTARPRGLSGECGALAGFPTGNLLAILGPGEALPPAVREEMEAAFGADFGRVRLHTGLAAQRISEELGAEAFAIGNHVAFRRGRFQPRSDLGWELLRHELAHTLEAEGREDRIYGWFTLLLNGGDQTYRLDGRNRTVTVGGGHGVKTHEIITKEALDYVSRHGASFSEGALTIIVAWVAEIDRWKDSLDQLASRRSPGAAQPEFPELSALIQSAGSAQGAVRLLHAYGGQDPGQIGMTISDVLHARLTGGGVIGSLLDQAVSRYTNGQDHHALALLGISLHMIQDFYSHNVPLRDQQGRDLRAAALSEDPHQLLLAGIRTPAVNQSILEDDPNLDWRRYENARHRTSEQLRNFHGRVVSRDAQVSVRIVPAQPFWR
jgi:hypothetical protein